MDRCLRRTTGLLALVALAVVLNAGCRLVPTAMWIMNPKDAPAEFKGLKSQRVVVVCRPMNSLDIGNASVATQLAKGVGRKLREHGKDITVIPQSEVDDWLDNNEMQSFVEVGKAVGADKVVAIELGHFSLGSDSTLFQGNADAEVTVFDVESGDVDYSRDPLETRYPPETPVSRDSSTTDATFRRKFVTVLADQIARTFYAYDSREANKRDIFFP